MEPHHVSQLHLQPWRLLTLAVSMLLFFPSSTIAAPSQDLEHTFQAAVKTTDRPAALFEPLPNKQRNRIRPLWRQFESGNNGTHSATIGNMTNATSGDPRRYRFPSSPKANPKAVVTGGRAGGHYRFTVLTDKLLRYEWSRDGQFEDRASTFAPFRFFDAPRFRVVDESNKLEIITDSFHLIYNKGDFSPENLVVRVGKDTWRYDGQSYGDLNGTARTLDGADGRIPLDAGIMSKKKAYAVLDDSKSMLFGEDGLITPREEGRLDGYVFAHGRDYKGAIKDFYKISGQQPILPRWTLSNWWSRFHKYTTQEYLDLMDRFKAEEIPLGVGVIDMDWHLVNIPKEYGDGWGGYTWNKTLIPDPEAFLKGLHERGLRVALNDHPDNGIRAFEDLYPQVAKAMGLDPSKGDAIEFDITDRKFVDAYFDVLKAELEKQGVDFWWIDWQQGEIGRPGAKIPGADPLWALNHYHYLTSQRNLKTIERPITFSRYAGPGSHRYPIGFSGDTIVTWESLNFQPEFTATASNIGFGWWSHDIGGHYWGERSNDMVARWLQLGCFSPILRLHTTNSEWISKEPWLWEPATGAVMKQFLQLRHRLIPFLFTMNVRASLESEPLVQPMYWHHPNDDNAYSVPNQYYFGPDLIVAPITTPMSKDTLMGSVKAWLPVGRYVDLLHPSLVYDGGRHVTLSRPLSEIPVLAKEGTILPLDATPQLINSTGNPADLEIQLVVGADGHFTVVEEDETLPSESRFQINSFVRTEITWEQATGKLSIGPATGAAEPSKLPKTRHYLLKLVGFTNTSSLSTSSPFTTNVSDHSTFIDFGSISTTQGVHTNLGKDLQLDVVDMVGRMREMLYRVEMNYPLKESLWNILTNNLEPPEPLHERIKLIYDHQPAISAELVNAIMEIWFADERSAKDAGDDGSGSRTSPGVEDETGHSRVMKLPFRAGQLARDGIAKGSRPSSAGSWDFVGEDSGANTPRSVPGS